MLADLAGVQQERNYFGRIGEVADEGKVTLKHAKNHVGDYLALDGCALRPGDVHSANPL